MGKQVLPLIFLVISFLLVPSTGQAQFLPVNASGKCEMTEVVIAEGFSKATLFANEMKWLKRLTSKDGKLNSVVKDSIAGKISGNFEYLVYAQSGVLRKVAASISYHFSVETKYEKYRYSFNDFIYHYYAQDRNYRMVKTGNTKPLEETKATGWQKLWTEHRKTIFSLVSNQVDELKVRMIEKPKTANEKAKEKMVDW